MTARDLLRLVLSNLRRMKARVAMTAIGVVIGTAAVVILVSLAAGLQKSATEEMGSIGDLTQITVHAPTVFYAGGGPPSRAGEEVLDDRTLADFRRLPDVVAATPRERLMGGATLRLSRLAGHVQITGIDTREAQRLDLPLASGAARLGRWQAVVGALVADEFYDPRSGRPVAVPPDLQGQRVELVLNRMGDDGQPIERTVRLRVTGVLEEAGWQHDYSVYLGLDDVVELNRWFSAASYDPGRDGYSEALVKVAAPEKVLAVEERIRQEGFYAQSTRSMLQGVNTVFLIIQGVFGGIGAIALVVAAFGIANTMTMAIYERTREIGLMKAVGATNRDVMSVFLAEAGSIGVLGGLGGVLAGAVVGALIDLIAGAYLAAEAVRQSGAAASDTSFSLVHTPLWLPVFAVVFAALVGVASGLYPAMRAAALNPVAALKYE